MKKVVVGIGEILWDMLPEGKALGGAPSNFACHVAQLGMDSYLASAVGRDVAGAEAIERCNRHGVSCSALQRNSLPTGSVRVSLDGEGVPRYEIMPDVAWDAIDFNSELEQLARRTVCVCFGTLAQRSATSRRAIREFLRAMPDADDTLKVFDINLRQSFYSREVVVASLGACNILKVNDEEIVEVARLLGYRTTDADEVIRLLIAEYQLRAVVLTRGADGSSVYAFGTVSTLPTPKVDVADTVGAGDAFTAAFCAVLLRGGTFDDAHRKAVEVAAYVCSCHGATPELPEALRRM